MKCILLNKVLKQFYLTITEASYNTLQTSNRFTGPRQQEDPNQNLHKALVGGGRYLEHVARERHQRAEDRTGERSQVYGLRTSEEVHSQSEFQQGVDHHAEVLCWLCGGRLQSDSHLPSRGL